MFYFDVVLQNESNNLIGVFNKNLVIDSKNSLPSIRRLKDALGQRAHCFVTQVYTCTNEIIHSFRFKSHLNFLNMAFP